VPYQQHQYHPQQQQQPTQAAMNPLVAAALANMPGVRMAGQVSCLSNVFHFVSVCKLGIYAAHCIGVSLCV
jgi:hypothetical protein